MSDNARLSEPAPSIPASAAALAYRDLLHRFETACRSARRGGAEVALGDAAWHALKRRHGALQAAAGFDRVLLDGEAQGRVASYFRA